MSCNEKYTPIEVMNLMPTEQKNNLECSYINKNIKD